MVSDDPLEFSAVVASPYAPVSRNHDGVNAATSQSKSSGPGAVALGSKTLSLNERALIRIYTG